MKSRTFTFDNGLRLVFTNVEKSRPATLFVCVKTGSGNEASENNGISHFIEHLNFKGTEKRSAKQISVDFESIGANANAFTSKNHTCFFATTLPDKIENCFDIISDIMFNSKYSQADINRERKVIFEEIDMYQDDPEAVCYDEFCKNFYFGTSLERTVLGTKESLEKISRQDILDYIATNYTAPNIIVSVVGAFPFEKVKSLTKKYFASRFKGKNTIEEPIKSQVIIPEYRFSCVKKDVAQTQIAFGFACDNVYSENRMALLLISFIFGGSMGSRLFQKVREEKGLVYSISCVPELSTNGGDMLISLGTNRKNQKEALQLVKNEIDFLVDNGFTEEELDRAKIFCKSIVLSSSELGFDIAKANALNMSSFNMPMNTLEKIEKIEAVTLEQINTLAEKVFNFSNVCGAVVSSGDDEEIFEIFNS